VTRHKYGGRGFGEIGGPKARGEIHSADEPGREQEARVIIRCADHEFVLGSEPVSFGV
jgi:hypothetical protein